MSLGHWGEEKWVAQFALHYCPQLSPFSSPKGAASVFILLPGHDDFFSPAILFVPVNHTIMQCIGGLAESLMPHCFWEEGCHHLQQMSPMPNSITYLLPEHLLKCLANVQLGVGCVCSTSFCTGNCIVAPLHASSHSTSWNFATSSVSSQA